MSISSLTLQIPSEKELPLPPTPNDSERDLKSPKRFHFRHCCIRRRPTKKQAIICCVVTSILIIILVLVILFAIVPKVIQNVFADNPFFLYPSDINVTMNPNNSISFNFTGDVFLMGLPLSTTLAPAVFTVSTKVDNKPIIVEVPLPTLELYKSQRTKLQFSSALGLGDLGVISRMIREISGTGLSKDLEEIVFSADVRATALGLSVPSTSVSRVVSLANITTSKLISSLLRNQPIFASTTEDPTLGSDPLPPVSNFTLPQVQGIVPRDVKFSGIFISQMSLETSINMVNPLPISVAVNSTAVNFNLADNRVIRVGVRNLALPSRSAGATTLRPILDFQLPAGFGGITTTITSLIGDMIASRSVLLPVSISGPVDWGVGAGRVEWVRTVTEGLKVPVSVSELLGAGRV